MLTPLVCKAGRMVFETVAAYRTFAVPSRTVRKREIGGNPQLTGQ
jgi:hypothetical protein